MKFCLHDGCKTRVERGYCIAHARERERVHRGSASERGYNWNWHVQSTAFLAEFPLCGMREGGVAPVMSRCHADGRVTAATLVDHVEPQRGDQVKFWDRRNWQSLCRECHDAKTKAGQ